MAVEEAPGQGGAAIPPQSDPRWRELVTGAVKPAFSNLGLRFLMTRLTSSTGRDGSAANVEKCAADVHAFFVKYCAAVAQDLAKLEGGGR
jgi:uncharacterized membrane protein